MENSFYLLNVNYVIYILILHSQTFYFNLAMLTYHAFLSLREVPGSCFMHMPHNEAHIYHNESLTHVSVGVGPEPPPKDATDMQEFKD